MSLKQLFAAVTALAVFFWCAAQTGFDNGMFWGVAFISLIMSAMWFGLYRTKFRWLTMLTPLPFVFFCGAILGSTVLLIHAALLFLVGLFVTLESDITAKTVLAILLVCMLSSLTVGALIGRAAMQNLAA